MATSKKIKIDPKRLKKLNKMLSGHSSNISPEAASLIWLSSFTILLSVATYFSANAVNQKIYDILMNITCSLWSVIILFFVYERVRSFKEKESTIFARHHIKKSLDSVLLSTCSIFAGILSFEEGRAMPSGTGRWSIVSDSTKEEIAKKLAKPIPLCLILKSVKENYESLYKLVSSPFVLKFSDNKQMRAILKVASILESFDDMQEFKSRRQNPMYEMMQKKDVNHSITIAEIKKDGIQKALILMTKDLKKGYGVVTSWGDYKKDDVPNLLNYALIQPEYVKRMTEIIYSFGKLYSALLEDAGGFIIGMQSVERLTNNGADL